MEVSYLKLLVEEVSEKLERNPDGKNTSTWTPLDRVEVEKLLVGEADGE